MSTPLTRETIDMNLEVLGLYLPASAASPKGSYRVVRVDLGVAYTSALGPFSLDGSGGFTHVGQVGTDVDIEGGRTAASVTAVNLIAAVEESVGVASVAHVIELMVYVRARTGFEDHAFVADGASEVLHTAFGLELGAHVRTVVGVRTLPFGLPVVASMKVRLTGETR